MHCSHLVLPVLKECLSGPYIRTRYCRREHCSKNSLYSFGGGFIFFPILSFSILCGK